MFILQKNKFEFFVTVTILILAAAISLADTHGAHHG